MKANFLALYPLVHHPEGAAFFRAYGQPHERLCSLPVSVLFRVDSAEKTNQEGRDENRTRLAGSIDHSAVVAPHMKTIGRENYRQHEQKDCPNHKVVAFSEQHRLVKHRESAP